ncbi:MAG: hypothetical protein ATN31_08030 [Candidatus Epulonipiscioides saccharophilum]|nr:MAG: hypothetical protein ATN31_08030 [Epulopiscium sp. AS2M-Bin001]
MKYYISKQGSDNNSGKNESDAFLTINKAAKIAMPGDEIIVLSGIYREWINPENGGNSDIERITYTAKDGDLVVIKGSDEIKGWQHLEAGVYFVELDNKIFADFNPFAEELFGDWFKYPKIPKMHLGTVYLNGKAFCELRNLDEVKDYTTGRNVVEDPKAFGKRRYLEKDGPFYGFFAQVDADKTIIYANFNDFNPNEEQVEVSVRKCCFYPKKIGRNYITVKNFTMCHGSSGWAPPTAEQPAIIGANWSKGWIIENNIVHDAKCSGISIGKDYLSGDMLSTKTKQKSGYQFQLESVFAALKLGWSKETVGSHIIRNNTVYDCGQNGIVGHMGCAFSKIYNNHVYNIGIKREYIGCEIAGIKFHAPIDTQIYNNRVHDTVLGLWLDWQTQGLRVSSNLLYKNARDMVIEVSHGPTIIDNNIFGSKGNIGYISQGTAYIHNLFCGTMANGDVLDRATPYHLPHSTWVSGYGFVYSGDDRYYNNIYVAPPKNPNQNEKMFSGTKPMDKFTNSLEEYFESIHQKDFESIDLEKFDQTPYPVYVDGNVYYNGAEAFSNEENNHVDLNYNPQAKIIEESGDVYLEIELPPETFNVNTKLYGTENLGKTILVNAIFDDPDANMLHIDKDYFGNVRSQQPTIGPLEDLKVGKNRIKLT